MRWMLKAAITVMISGMLALAGTAQMSGDYTIDPQGAGPRNFTTFAAATAALSAGVSGPVVFTVASTVFQERVQIGAVSGASSVNTITFAARGNPATIDATGGGSYAVGILVRAEWVRIENLRITGWSGTGLFLDYSAKNNLISRVVVESPARGARYAVGIFGTRNTLRSCTFRGGDIVVYHEGVETMIDACEMDGLGTSRDVLDLWIGNRSTVQNCLVHGAGNGVCFGWQDSSIVSNNLFLANTSKPAVANVTSTSAVRSWSAGSTFKNNIVINLGSGPAMSYELMDANTNAKLNPVVSAHNCLYGPNSSGTIEVANDRWQKIYFRGSLAKFQSWQSANPQYLQAGGAAGFELNSVEGDPGVVSLTAPYDIHLKPTSPLIDRGTATIVEPYQTQIPPHSVTHDVDGEVRGWKPDIGADEIAARLSGSGGTSPGSTHLLGLAAARDGGRAYQVGSSFGIGPIKIGWRPLGLGADDLLVLSVGNYWPQVFAGYRGTLDASGNGQASIRLPKITALVGQVIHSAFVTVDPSAKFGIGAISNTYSLTVTK